MFKELESAELRFEAMGAKLSDPSVTGDAKAYAALMKEYSALSQILEK